MQSTTAQHGRAAAEPAPPRLKVAYVVSRFPKLTETFVLYEILALQQRGVDVVVFPLLSLRNASTRQGASLWGKLLELVRKPRSTPVMHREAEAMLGLARYHPFLSWSVLRAQWHYVRRRPRAYFGALAALVRGNRRSRRFLLAGLALFPKTVLAARQVEELGVGHVHAHFANHPAAAAFVIGRLTGVPYSFTAHGSDLHVDRSMLAEKVGEAKYVVAISQYNRAMILEECGERFRDRVHVIHCGVDTDVFRPSEQRGEARAESGDGCPERRDGEAGNRTPHTTHHSPLTTSPPTTDRSPLAPLRSLHVLSIGTMHEVKGQRYLIEAAGLLRKRGLDVVCHLVGTGPDEPALRRQVAEAGLADRVVFHGRLTRDEVAALLQRVDVVAAPSVPTSDGRREGIPVVLMEAMAAGVPVVSTEISGIPELVEHCKSGLLVPPRDSRRLAEALACLFHDPALCRLLAGGGRDKVVREFNLKKNAAALAELFEGDRRDSQKEPGPVPPVRPDTGRLCQSEADTGRCSNSEAETGRLSREAAEVPQ